MSAIPEHDSAVIDEPQEQIEALEPEEQQPEAVERGGEVVAAGYDTPEHAGRAEHLLGRSWAIVPEVLIELAASPMMVTDEVRAEQRAQAQQRQAAANGASGGGSIAVIPLCGVVSPRGSMLARLFGMPSGLEAFRDSFQQALADDSVSAIMIDVDSPGGLIDMVPETAAQIREARGAKPIVAVANTMCASAAYWIASQADELVVTPSGQVGSIGVFTVHEDVSQLSNAMGVKTTIVSAGRFKTEGNPYEPLSKQAKQQMQSDVDTIYSMFVSDVAAGRGVPVQAVTAGYGEGRCVLAQQALALKMVDRVETFEQTAARLGGNLQDDATTEPDVEVEVEIDPTDNDGPDGPEAASGSRSDAAAVDYLSVGVPPAWQIGASRPSVGGRL